MSEEEKPRPGLMINGYRLIAPIGKGGMGEVWEALDIALNRKVVIKLLHAEMAKSDSLRDRLRLEGQAQASLSQHANIAAVIQLGATERGRPYLVMERLYGRTLKEELKARGPLPLLEAIDYIRQALAGLAAAHARGFIHRDIKLDNLFLCDPNGDGRRIVKVLDFGIAKVLTAEAGVAALAIPTEAGASVGTPKFFSSEQARAIPNIDHRSDLYSTALCLFTLVAGCGPFDHHSHLIEIVQAHVLEAPKPPSAYARQSVPAALDRVVLKALSKRPEDRHATAEAFAEELAEIAASLATRAADAERNPGVAPAPKTVSLAQQKKTIRMPDAPTHPAGHRVGPPEVTTPFDDVASAAPRAIAVKRDPPAQRSPDALSLSRNTKGFVAAVVVGAIVFAALTTVAILRVMG